MTSCRHHHVVAAGAGTVEESTSWRPVGDAAAAGTWTYPPAAVGVRCAVGDGWAAPVTVAPPSATACRLEGVAASAGWWIYPGGAARIIVQQPAARWHLRQAGAGFPESSEVKMGRGGHWLVEVFAAPLYHLEMKHNAGNWIVAIVRVARRFRRSWLAGSISHACLPCQTSSACIELVQHFNSAETRSTQWNPDAATGHEIYMMQIIAT